MKKTSKNIVIGFMSFIAIFVLLFIIDVLSEENKLSVFKQDMVNDYYDEDKLNKVLKEHLGDAYEGEILADFDNFVISLVMDEFAELEDEKNQRYNSFLDKKWMEEYNEEGEKEADEIAGEPLEDDIYYLKLSTFHDGSTYKKVNSLASEFKKYDHLIIDLRDNTGGSFDELEKVLNIFVPDGKLLFQLNERNKTQKVYSKNKEPMTFKKIVLLTNDMTASSSELLILSLKENLDNVTQIGTTTYGKENGISIRTFKDGSGLVFISSKMEGPNETFISAKGIDPDIEVGESMKEAEGEGDLEKPKEIREKEAKEQLQAAIDFLNEKK